jgi:imidazolonepropionase-like amidohydrolase/Tol biopolymer transport system component
MRPNRLLPGIAAVLLPCALLAQDPPRRDTAQAKDPMQEGLPLKPTRTLEFTTTEGSWISVDVSPDGQTLVFDLLGDLYTMPIGGGKATPLTQGMAMDGQPRFSPDGSRIVFTSDRSGGEGVWIMSLDSKDTVQVTRGKGDKYDSPEWTPDGRYVIASNDNTLYMYHVDGGGGGIELIREAEPATGGRGGGNTGGALRRMGASFGDSPRYIWYAQRRGSWQYNTPLPDYQLGVYDRESGEVSTRTSRTGSAFRPTLSPDGRWLVYGTRYDGQTGLVKRDLRTSEESWLAYPVQRDDQESRATLDTYPGMSFTPDSRNVITFYGGRLWSIPVDGSPPKNIPFSVDVKLAMGPAVKFEYDVDDSPTFTVKQIREAVPSPDDSKLAFIALDRLWIMDWPNGTPRRLSNDEVVEFNPVWTPDGQSVIYASWQDDEGGRINRVNIAAGAQRQRLTPAAGLYQDIAVTPDGQRVIATRSSAEAYIEEDNRGASEIVWLPATGGEPTFIATTEGRGDWHFRANEPDRIFAFGGGRLVSFRWDGLDEKEIVRVGGGGGGGGGGSGGGSASLIQYAPTGDQALAQVGNDIFVLTVPEVGGPAPSVAVNNPESAAFPVRKLTEIGGQFPTWNADASKVHYSIGNAHVVYDLARAKAFDDSVRAARRAAGETDSTRAQGDTAQTRGGRSRETPRFQPLEKRVLIQASRDIPTGAAVLRGARVITMRGDEVIENADIVIRDNRIEAVGARGQVQVPQGAQVIDVTGKTITPGYIDTHAHLRARGVHRTQNWSYAANLAFGVTATRDPQTGTTDVLSYEDLVARGDVLGPRIYSTGPGVFSSENIRDLEHARRVLKRYSEYYDTKTIKQYVAGNREQRQWIIQAAHELNLMPTTEGSLDIEMNLTEAFDGYSGHEHSWPAFPMHSDWIRMFAWSGIAYTPTILVAYGGPWAENFYYATEDVIGDDKLAYFTPHDEIASKARRRDAGWFHSEEHVFRLIGATVKQLVDAGGTAGVGSHGQLQGLGYHWELWSIQAGGMSNHDALRVATTLGARAIGLENDLGTLEAGKLADLVILNTNPLDDIRNTKDIQSVMKNGRLYEGNTLNEIYPRQRTVHFYWNTGKPATEAPAGIETALPGSGK